MILRPEEVKRAVQDAVQGMDATLQEFAKKTHKLAWRHCLYRRLCNASDNHYLHEVIVLGSGCRIRRELSIEDQRIGILVDVLHDIRAMIRSGVTELDIAEAEGRSQERIKKRRIDSRYEHMNGSADDAKQIGTKLRALYGDEFVSGQELNRAVELIAKHDLIKTGQPYPGATDWLAVCCYEADLLWTIHPVGLVADINRGRNMFAPDQWQTQLDHNIKQFKRWRVELEKSPDAGEFIDEETVFRTSEGHAIYIEWLQYWERSFGSSC